MVACLSIALFSKETPGVAGPSQLFNCCSSTWNTDRREELVKGVVRHRRYITERYISKATGMMSIDEHAATRPRLMDICGTFRGWEECLLVGWELADRRCSSSTAVPPSLVFYAHSLLYFFLSLTRAVSAKHSTGDTELQQLQRWPVCGVKCETWTELLAGIWAGHHSW